MVDKHEFSRTQLWVSTHIVIIAVGTVFVALLVVGHVLAKSFLALFANEHHLVRLLEFMILGFRMAFCTIKPLFAAWCTN